MKPLLDSCGRTHTYLRISVTDRCNLRCAYCMPPEKIDWKPREEILQLEELARLARLFARMGVTKIRLTGGEPLIRRNIEQLIAEIADIPTVETIGLTTNGVLLKEKVSMLRRAGVTRLNLSLDTLRPDRYEQLTGSDYYHTVLEGIDAAVDAGFGPLKVNVVVMGGYNDDELLDFVEFARDKLLSVRFIEYMPFQDNGWSPAQFVPAARMMEVIGGNYHLTPVGGESNAVQTAKEFRVEGLVGTVGFITSLSDHFCDTCNRIRLSADGSLITCLHHPAEVNLRQTLRSGMPDGVLEEIIREALLLKPPGHASLEELVQQENRTMIEVGG